MNKLVMNNRLSEIAKNHRILYKKNILVYPDFMISFKKQLGIIKHNGHLGLLSDDGIILDWEGKEYYETLKEFICCSFQSKK